MQLTTIGSLSGNRKIKAAVMGLMVLAVAREGLLLLTYFEMQSYSDYVNSTCSRLFWGALYRLPKVAEMRQPIPRDLRGVPSWRLALVGT
jgi:hypothetical protein